MLVQLQEQLFCVKIKVYVATNAMCVGISEHSRRQSMDIMFYSHHFSACNEPSLISDCLEISLQRLNKRIGD